MTARLGGQLYLWQSLVASYRALVPLRTSDVLRRAADLPAAEHLGFLRLGGVGALVVHADELDPAARAAMLAALDASPQAERRAEVGGAVIYALPPDPRLSAIDEVAGPGGAVFISADERVPGVAALAIARRLAAAGHTVYVAARPR